jgi:glycosyl transferase family 1
MQPPEVAPKLVFFRWTRAGLPHFIQQHLEEQLRCLRQHFDVVVIDDDCDYGEVCETHRPDMTLFESGVYAGPRRITNTSACPEVPKVGFYNGDAYCATRSVFLSDMERWGVETFFTLSVAMAEYTPDIADRLFVWPNFVDADVYRDYGQAKTIPVLFTGSQAAHYPWRSRVHSIVTQHYPCLTTPHAGWFDDKGAGRMVHGGRYASLLNSAAVAPTCGTIAREAIRKHFEIPAARTCLVTERTASIEAAGFVDMENVVFAEPGEVMDKLDHLFANPEELQRITDAGYELVHSRHTMAQRDQLLQWLRLHQTAEPGQSIVQDGPFQPLRLTSASGARNSHAISGALDRTLLREGERLLEHGRHEAAEERFMRCLNYHFMPEPVLGLARRHLHGGDAGAAIGWVRQTIERSLVDHGAQDPDPVEWAFFVRALLCQGKVDEAAQRAAQFSWMSHVELERIRHVAFALAGLDRSPAASGAPNRADRRSVHVLPDRGERAWVNDLCAMLDACGQGRLVDAVRAGSPAPDRVGTTSAGAGATGAQVLPLVAEPYLARARQQARSELRSRWQKLAAKAPHAVVRNLLQKEDVHNALLLGASATARCTRAVLTGLRSNPGNPRIYWLNDATPRLLPGRGRRPGERLADAAALASKRDEHGNAFDVVVVGGSSELERDEREILTTAQFVVLTQINRSTTQRIHSGLIQDRAYALVTHHPSHDGGYSVFRKLRETPVATSA